MVLYNLFDQLLPILTAITHLNINQNISNNNLSSSVDFGELMDCRLLFLPHLISYAPNMASKLSEIDYPVGKEITGSIGNDREGNNKSNKKISLSSSSTSSSSSYSSSSTSASSSSATSKSGKKGKPSWFKL